MQFDNRPGHVGNRQPGRAILVLHALRLPFLSRVSSISWFHLFAIFIRFVVFPSPLQPTPANRESSLRQPPFPPLAGADRRRLVEQPVFLLLLRQPGEPGHQPVARRKECFLSVEDGGFVLVA